MNDFWIACGHHLLDRDESGGLRVTDEFLKAYFARPELMPPDDACPVERRVHRELLADPRLPVGRRGDLPGSPMRMPGRTGSSCWPFAISCCDIRRWKRPILRSVRSGSKRPAAAVRQPARARDPAQRARRLRRPFRAARRRVILPAAADPAARAGLAAGRRRDRRRAKPDPGAVADVDAGGNDTMRWSTCLSERPPTAIGSGATSSTWRLTSRPADGGRPRWRRRWRAGSPSARHRRCHLAAARAARRAAHLVCRARCRRDSARRPSLARRGTRRAQRRPRARAVSADLADSAAQALEDVGDEPVYLILSMTPDRKLRMKPQNLLTGLPIKHLEMVT